MADSFWNCWYYEEYDEDGHIVVHQCTSIADIVKSRVDEDLGTQPSRAVGLTVLADGVRVSTIFLGMDHGYVPESPILYETVVFSADKLRRELLL